MQADDGGSVYLRLSTRTVAQPQRQMTDGLREDVLSGAYWLREPAEGAELAIVFCGAVAPEAEAAWQQVAEDIPGAGLMCVTSPDRLYQDYRAAWRRRAAGDIYARSHVGRLADRLARDAVLVTVLDGHPASLGWVGSAARRRVFSLGVEGFGQSGDIPDLYRIHNIDADAILEACAAACLARIHT
jgi:pyruvate dehydrogenase E1 component